MKQSVQVAFAGSFEHFHVNDCKVNIEFYGSCGKAGACSILVHVGDSACLDFLRYTLFLPLL